MAIEAFLNVEYIISVFHVFIFEKMGVVVARPHSN